MIDRERRRGWTALFQIYMGRCCRAGLLFLLLTGAGLADDNKVHRFAGTTFPLIFEEDGIDGHRGLAVDILNRISEQTGLTFQMELYPWARALALAKVGTVDGLIGPYWSAERAEFLDYSTRHFYSDRMVFVARRNADIGWDGDFAKLEDRRILIMQGWAYGPAFDEVRDRLNSNVVSNFDQALRMLSIDRVDLLAANERTALVGLNALQLGGKLEILTPAFHQTAGFFGFPKVRQSPADKEFRDRFNAALERLWTSGALEEMSARYSLVP